MVELRRNGKIMSHGRRRNSAQMRPDHCVIEGVQVYAVGIARVSLLRRLWETIQRDTLLSLDTADPVSRDLRLEAFQRGGRRGAIDDIVACCQPGEDFQIDIGRVMNQVAIIAEIVGNFLHRAKVI
jgi:hypothetical protein